MTLDPFQTLVVLGLAIIGAVVILLFVFAIVNGAFGLGLLEKFEKRPPPAEPTSSGDLADDDCDNLELVDRIMALPKERRVALRILVEVMELDK